MNTNAAAQDAFELGIDQFFAEAKQQTVKNFKVFVLDLAWAIIEGTPVDTGMLARAWAVEFNQPGGYIPQKRSARGDASKQAAFNAVRRKMGELRDLKEMPHCAYIYNNLPYAHAIEYGHSQVKAPKGMVRVAIAEIKGKFGI